jgi:hypothetical protein
MDAHAELATRGDVQSLTMAAAPRPLWRDFHALGFPGRLRFLFWKLDYASQRLNRIRNRVQMLKAGLDLSFADATVIQLFDQVDRAARAKGLWFPAETLVSALLYVQAQHYGQTIDFAVFSALTGLTKRHLFRFLSRLASAGLRPPQTRMNIAARRNSALAMLDTIRERFALPRPIYISARSILIRRNLSPIPRVSVMAALLASQHHCYSAGLVKFCTEPLMPIFKALRAAPSTAYKLGRKFKLFPLPPPMPRSAKGNRVSVGT